VLTNQLKRAENRDYNDLNNKQTRKNDQKSDSNQIEANNHCSHTVKKMLALFSVLVQSYIKQTFEL
jgi:hypothetical protein